MGVRVTAKTGINGKTISAPGPSTGSIMKSPRAKLMVTNAFTNSTGKIIRVNNKINSDCKTDSNDKCFPKNCRMNDVIGSITHARVSSMIIPSGAAGPNSTEVCEMAANVFGSSMIIRGIYPRMPLMLLMA